MTDKSAKTAGRVLLPSYVKPEKYDLKVTPDFVHYSFDGIVSIDMTTGESFTEDESKKITLHTKELMFRTAEFKTEEGKVVAAEEVSLPPGLCCSAPVVDVYAASSCVVLMFQCFFTNVIVSLLSSTGVDQHQPQDKNGHLCLRRVLAKVEQDHSKNRLCGVIEQSDGRILSFPLQGY